MFNDRAVNPAARCEAQCSRLTMPLLKPPLLLISSLCVHIALTSPNLPASSTEVSRYKDRWNKTWIKWGPTYLKALYWVLSLCEAAVICAQDAPSPAYTLVRSSSSSAPSHPTITAPFMAGWVLITFAGILRLICYRTLGRFFTFELSIRDKHKLITSGPYGWVRHPSYSGAILSLIGYFVCMWGPGSLLYECGWVTTVVGKAALVGMAAQLAWVASVLVWRPIQEDEVLRQEFGSQWDDWAQRVRYRLVPGIY
ncbi:hypothetical protein EWM64_g4392 [Hericium alpestre]|uniref:Protein-S-isoprenylcysteine O-methyltransferase n=1 Tax=Hericium alpestre TaxID=135208 RepID=A0A4Y9ZZZ1_9AGAM|nr:hypothetical protein EWM64_g4392 [Hericium alpestre]